LAFEDAQNTAQRSKDMSNDLEDAYKATTDIGELSKLFKGFASGLEENKMYNPSATGINAPSMFKPTQGQYGPQRKVFAGGYYQTDPYGNLKTEASEIARKLSSGELVGFAPMGGGQGYTEQTSTSNIAPYGFHVENKKLVRDVVSGLSSMPSQGLPASEHETYYSGTGTTELPDWLNKRKKEEADAIAKKKADADKKNQNK